MLVPSILVHVDTVDAATPENGFPGTLNVLCGHVYFYAWYWAMFKAMQANDMPLIESLWQAILTVTIHCRVSLSMSEKMLWSMQQSEKLKAENFQADNFLSFGRKAAALLNDANLTQERVPTFFETRIEPSPVGKSNAPDPRRIAGADRFREMISSPATAWKIKRPRADKLMGPISFPNHLAEKQTPPTPGASLGQLGSRRPFPPTISHKMKRPRPQVHRWGRWAQGCQFHPRFFYRKGKASNKKKSAPGATRVFAAERRAVQQDFD